MYSGNPDVPDDVFVDVLKQINHFVRDRVVPRELEIMSTDAIPADLRAQAADMGLFGYAIPQEWGGLGLDLVQDVEVAMELGYTSLSLRSMFGTNNGIAGQVLVGFGTDEQKARWMPGIASGDVVASFALTEPGAGSNPAGLKTTAKPSGGGWIIDGRKQFITSLDFSCDLAGHGGGGAGWLGGLLCRRRVWEVARCHSGRAGFPRAGGSFVSSGHRGSGVR